MLFSLPNFHFGMQFLFWRIMLWVEIGGVDSGRVMGEHQFCQFMICNRNICAHHSVTGQVLLLLSTAYFKAEVALSENCVCSICWLTKFNFARFGSSSSWSWCLCINIWFCLSFTLFLQKPNNITPHPEIMVGVTFLLSFYPTAKFTLPFQMALLRHNINCLLSIC